MRQENAAGDDPNTMVEIIDDLEKFLSIQRRKLESDKEFLDKATITHSDGQSSLTPKNVFVPRSQNSPRFQANAATQTEVAEEVVLTAPKTDDSKLMSIKSMRKGSFTETSSHDHPKYGLPGIGEYEERNKQLRLEEKRELNRYLQQAIEAKKNAKNNSLDYNDILSKKRNEELRYREINEGYFDNLSASLGTSDLIPALNDNAAFQRIRSLPYDLNVTNVKKESETLADMQLTEMDDFYRLPTITQSEPLPSIRSSQFRSADNIRVGPILGLNNLTPRPSTLPDLDRPRELPPNPLVGVVPQENDLNMRNSRLQKVEYRNQLEQQIHDQKIQKRRLNNDERAIPQLDPLSTNLYNRIGNGVSDYPWGRSGAGAPNRDLHGNIITRRGYNSNIVNTALPFYENSAHTLEGHRKLPDRWHEGHWPLPEDKQLPRPQYNYHDELREQIEQKRRREQQERDMQRLEDERLARRFESQREKIQAEYEAELQKQKRREEEHRRKAERILEMQENERKEARKQKLYEKEWWEKETPKPSSPPIMPAKQDTPEVASHLLLPQQQLDMTTSRQHTPQQEILPSHHSESASVFKPPEPPQKSHFEAVAISKPVSSATSHFETPPQSENDADDYNVPLSDHTGSKGSEADDECTLAEFPLTERRIAPPPERRVTPQIFAREMSSNPSSASPPIPTLRYKDAQRRDDFTFIELEYQSENDSMYEKENAPTKAFELLPSSPTKVKSRRRSPFQETSNAYTVISPASSAKRRLPQDRAIQHSELISPAQRSSSRHSSRNSSRGIAQVNSIRSSPRINAQDNSLHNSPRVIAQDSINSDDLYASSSRSSIMEPLRVPMISQEDLPPLTNKVDSSSPSLTDVDIHSNGKNQMEIISQLAAMRHQLHMERRRLQQEMKRDDKYEVYDSRLSDWKLSSPERRKRGQTQISTNKLDSKLDIRLPIVPISSKRTTRKQLQHSSINVLEFANNDGLDINEITSRNRERKNNLEKLKNENGLTDSRNSDADNVLDTFLKHQT